MKKGRIIFVHLLTFVMLILTACGTKTFKLENISKVEITDGSNGYTVEIAEKDQIQTLIQPFIDNEFTKGESSENHTGWSYRLRFYQDDKTITEIVVLSDSQIDFNGYFYDIENGTIDIDYYDDLLNNQE